MKKRGRLKFKVKTWMLILFLVPLLFLDATLLRLDHIKMTELRDAVLATDEAEDDEHDASKNTDKTTKNKVKANLFIIISLNNNYISGVSVKCAVKVSEESVSKSIISFLPVRRSFAGI